MLFPSKADGSQIKRDGKVVGSRLIGQDFKRDRRATSSRGPSATGYNPAGTFFNNLGPNQKDLRDLFRKNLAAYLKRERPYNPGLTAGDVPVDAVTTSGSGVDPHISEANARIQARRVAELRGSAAGARERADRREHRRSRARLPRRARRERARAEPGARPGGSAMTDQPDRSLHPALLRPAIVQSFTKLDPRHQIRNPVMFVVEIGAVITTIGWLIQAFGGSPLGGGDEPAWFSFTVASGCG